MECPKFRTGLDDIEGDTSQYRHNESHKAEMRRKDAGTIFRRKTEKLCGNRRRDDDRIAVFLRSLNLNNVLERRGNSAKHRRGIAIICGMTDA